MVASNSFTRVASPVRPSAQRLARATASRTEALHDAELVRRFNAGDETAFTEITTRYRAKMHVVARSVLRNDADAEEIAQDTFVRAHRGLARFRGDSSLSTWLHRITLNLSRNRYRYFARRHQQSTQSFDTMLSPDSTSTLASLIACDEPSPVQEAATAEFTEIVADCMTRLGAGHRDILTRRNVLNLTYGEIAVSFRISVGTVKSRIARARQNLRALLAKSCPEFSADSSPNEWLTEHRYSGQLEIACA